MLTIKRTNSSDKDFHSLVKKLDQDLWSRYGEVQLQYNQYNIIESNNTVVIAYIDEQPVGCGCFKPFDESSVEIKRMYVDDLHRGKGIGAAILQELENWASESGYLAAVLETAEGQPEAIHLYKKRGFVLIPNYGQYIDMELSICMKKNF